MLLAARIVERFDEEKGGSYRRQLAREIRGKLKEIEDGHAAAGNGQGHQG